MADRYIPPAVIETEAQNEAALAEVESLMKKGDGGRSEHEEALLRHLAALIARFEEKAYPIESES